MKVYATGQIRNVGLFSHVGAGKTSLVEAMLYDAGAITRLGTVDGGNTVSDYDPDEIKRKISINLSLVPVEWRDSKLNLIDTPGYADFVGEVMSALQVCDGALLVVDAGAGVQVGTEEMWRLIAERGLPRLAFINRLDRDNADFYRTLDQMRQFFGMGVAPLLIPIGAESNFHGVVDLVEAKAYSFSDKTVKEIPVPGDLEATSAEQRQVLVEAVVELDDELTEAYLEGKEIPLERLRAVLRDGVLAGKITPVLCGSATKNLGVQLLLDAIVRYLPSPAERAAVVAKRNGADETLKADPDVGKLSLLRVFSGTLRSDSRVWNPLKETEERIGQLLSVRGREQQPVPALVAGDIGAVAKLSVTLTGDTLCDRQRPLVLPKATFPHWVFTAAIEPKTKEDLEKLSNAIARIIEEDPTLHVERQASTGQTLLSGMGEVHVEVALERMKRKFGAEVTLVPVKVPYKETITAKATAEGRFVRQTGGHGQYGVCHIEIEPMPRGAGFEFVDKIVGGVISAPFREAVLKGVREAMHEGILAGGEVVDLRVTLFDGKEHPVDSSDLAFQIAGSLAFKEAMRKAAPVLLEPILKVRVQVPEDRMGDVIGDLTSRRAKVHAMNPVKAGIMEVEADVPMAEMLRYATDLRSLTQGRATFTSEFLAYEPVPSHIQQQVMETYQKEKAKASA